MLYRPIKMSDAALFFSGLSHTSRTGFQFRVSRVVAELTQADKDKLAERYNRITLEPEKLKMIDRFVADSRAVALNHKAVLSTRHQVFMPLLSLFCLDGHTKCLQEGGTEKEVIRPFV